MKIGVDLDGVVFDFLGSFLRFFKKETGIAVPLSQVTDYYWRIGDDPDKMQSLLFEVFDKFSPDGFRYLRTKPNAVESLQLLHNQGHDIRYITKRHIDVWDATVESFKAHNIPYTPEKLIFSQDKPTLVRRLQIDIHIDDHPTIVQDVANATGRAIVFDAPYNKTVKNDKIKRVTTWTEILNILDNLDT